MRDKLTLIVTEVRSGTDAIATASGQISSGNQDLSSRTEEQASSLAKLSDEDRLSATAQGFCAVTSEPLGSMGAPLKLSIKDQTIWVCCKGCEKKALANPDQTLAKVTELKAQVIANSAAKTKDK